jgi:hypothetical protein
MCEITEAARAGWGEGSAGTPVALFSSPMWFAYRAGQVLRAEGLANPIRVRMSRGYSVRIKPAGEPGRLVKFDGAALDRVSVSIDFKA